MSWSRVFALTKRIVAQLRRDRRTIGLVFVVPALLLLLLGYLLREESRPLVLAVVAEGHLGPMEKRARLLAEALREEEDDEGERVFEQVVELPYEEALAQIRADKVQGALLLDRQTLLNLPKLEQEAVTLRVLVEGSNVQTAERFVASLGFTLPRAIPKALRQARGLPEPEGSLEIEEEYLYGDPDLDLLDSMAPALIAFFALLFVFILCVVSFLRERTQGTLERLMISPLLRGEIILGYMLGFSLLALLQSLWVVILTIFVLRIHNAGNILVVFLVVAVLTVATVNLAIFLSAFARTEFQAIQFMPIVIAPQALLAGLFWPVEDLHPWLQLLAHLLPMTYAVDALREVMIKGFGVTTPAVATDLGVLVAFALGMVVLGTLTLRRQVA